jgi:hypothetical protein
LPEAFIQANGDAVHRVARIIRQHWPYHPQRIREEIAQGLLPLLTPLAETATLVTEETATLVTEETATLVTEEIRVNCERVVARAFTLRPGAK